MKRKLFLLLAAIMMVAAFTACTNDIDNPVKPKPLDDEDATLVTNDQELRSAVKDGASIKLANDIDLSNSTLSIPSGTKVTINLGGFTLDRKLTQRGEGGGQVITIREGATLNLSNGTLKGGWGGNSGGIANESGTANLTDVNITGCTGDDSGGGICNLGGTLTMKGGSLTGNISNDHGDPTGGGGIFNAEGATATLTDVTVTGNQAKSKGGGGICNYGTLTLDGCTITGNTCGKNGGGIYNFSTATLNMKGKMTITDNIGKEGLKHNVFLKENAVITVTGALTDSKIGITLEDETGTFTSGYKDNNSDVDPATIFTADLTGVMAVNTDDNNEVQLTNSLPDGDIYYIERSWDDASQTVKAEIKILASGSYTTLTGGDDITIQPGFYVVKSNIEHDDIDLVGDGVHHLILCDGAQVEADIVHVAPGHTLHIYGQAANSGKLYIPMGSDDQFEKESGIGGRNAEACGNVIIHGGDIHAEGKDLGGAGIGGGQNGNGGNVTIYGGNVFAQGGGGDDICGAGIGGGNAANGGTVTIYGGTIKADGYKGGAGIGSGNNDSHHGGTGPLSGERSPITGGTVIIYGGYVEAYGTDGGAGIGGGNNGGGADVTINGGIVKAWGGSSGAGIGTGIQGGSDAVHYTGKLTVNGGEVYAYGGDDGAGIGGGKDSNGSDVTITGGYVYAKGNGNGAGIGSGCESIYTGGLHGGKLTVIGGRVEAYGGTDAAGIGGGEDADGGTVTISGGYVYAKGSYGGAGIGGGEGGDGGNVTITGGTVHASAGSGDTGNRAIGPGYGDDVYGSLTIGDEMMVYSERMANVDERKNMCWYRTDVHVELCTHPGYTADTCPYHKH